jgi:hypothetical protein
MQYFCFALAFLLGIKMFAYCTGTRCLKNVCSFFYRYLAGTRPLPCKAPLDIFFYRY